MADHCHSEYSGCRSDLSLGALSDNTTKVLVCYQCGNRNVRLAIISSSSPEVGTTEATRSKNHVRWSSRRDFLLAMLSRVQHWAHAPMNIPGRQQRHRHGTGVRIRPGGSRCRDPQLHTAAAVVAALGTHVLAESAKIGRLALAAESTVGACNAAAPVSAHEVGHALTGALLHVAFHVFAGVVHQADQDVPPGARPRTWACPLRAFFSKHLGRVDAARLELGGQGLRT